MAPTRNAPHANRVPYLDIPTIGPANGITTVIRAGLQEGQRAVLIPGLYRDKVDLPEVPDEKGILPRNGRAGPDRIAQTQ